MSSCVPHTTPIVLSWFHTAGLMSSSQRPSGQSKTGCRDVAEAEMMVKLIAGDYPTTSGVLWSVVGGLRPSPPPFLTAKPVSGCGPNWELLPQLCRASAERCRPGFPNAGGFSASRPTRRSQNQLSIGLMDILLLEHATVRELSYQGLAEHDTAANFGNASKVPVLFGDWGYEDFGIKDHGHWESDEDFGSIRENLLLYVLCKTKNDNPSLWTDFQSILGPFSTWGTIRQTSA
ncbi:hypothetical protein C8R45DRAFT_945464 [Mycena sanguinolenta]|nr:hypothetical protein C8R45DRAFT_945464 [Mycena sanguinolenta]